MVLSPGTVTAEVGAEILFDKDTETLSLRGTNGYLSSDGGIMLKGDIAMDFMVPLPEAFFEEDDNFHFAHKVPIPGFPQIEKGWNESEEFDSLLLNGSRPESVRVDIRILQLVTIRLSAVEIIPIITSALLSGGTLTAAVEIFVDNLSDYLDAGISLNGGIASELTLAGKAITVNGAPVTHENRLVRAPNSDSTEGTYQMQSNYDEEFTYTFDFVASSNAYAKVSVLGGIEIWSYNQPFAEKRISIIPKDTFDLDFGGAATSANIDIPTEPSHEWTEPGLIPDPVLASAVRSALNRPSDPITPNAMLKLTELYAYGRFRGIKDLTGLEHAVNLKELELTGGHAFSDVSPLSGLKNLERLDLWGNSLSEVSLSNLPNLKELHLQSNPLSKVSLSGMLNLKILWLPGYAFSEVSLSDMPNLKRLNLQRNPLSKISLSNMPNLEYLSCGGNNVSEVSLSDMPNLKSPSLPGPTISKLSLSGLTNLTELHLPGHSLSEISLSDMPNLTKLSLDDNAISDVSGLLDIESLETLYLSNNAISDVSSLTELPNLKQLNLGNNLLSYASRSVHIPIMQARCVFVYFDERTSPILVKISGENQIGAPDLALPTPFVVQALDVEDKPIADVPIKFAVAQGRGKLSTTTATTDATGKAQTTLTLGPNPGTNTVAVIAEEFEKAVSFTATAVLDTVTPLRIAEDVNGDGVVNIQDLVLVSSNLGQVGENKADVNGDGVVNIQDLVKVSAALQ